MLGGLNCWPAANLRLRRGIERLLEPPRNRGMKSEGLHGRKGGTSNLDIHAIKKSEGGSASPKTMSIAEGQRFHYKRACQKNQAAKPQLFANALRTTRSTFVRLRLCSQRDDFA